MAKVSKRGGYSDRNGIKPENTEIQLKDFDIRTRVHFRNLLIELYEKIFINNWYDNEIQEFMRYVIGDVYAQPFELGAEYHPDRIFDMINNTIEKSNYDDVLTLIESIIQYWDGYLKKNNSNYYDIYNKKYRIKSLFEIVNDCFKTEYVGYRFIDGTISPISDLNEINTINETLNCKYQLVNEHISKANSLLADRNKPDYENSIKESITAVEAMSEIITGIKGKEATLANMLKKIEDKGIKIHGGLKSAFDKLYGYTSDANGIRHAGDIGGPSSTFEEAKFMLVACCAFINYLIALNAD